MFVETLIKSIVSNKDMPKVQVEREISPILELFLVDVFNSLGEKEKVEAIEKGQYILVGSEFPLSIDTTERSTNIDYLMFNKSNSTLYFVELKTDSSSFKLEQYESYKKLIEKVGKEGAGFLYEFLKGLSHKKYGIYRDMVDSKYGDLLGDWKKIKKAKLVYIAPEKLTKNVKRRKLEGQEAIGEISFLHFKDLHENSNIESKKYQDEWRVITKHLVDLDDN